MNTPPRRQLLRPPPLSAPGDDLRRERHREELARLREALKHWLSRLQGTANKVFELQHCITRLEAQQRAG